MISAEWNNTVFFAGEQTSYTHGWIQGAFEAGIGAAIQLYNTAAPNNRVKAKRGKRGGTRSKKP